MEGWPAGLRGPRGSGRSSRAVAVGEQPVGANLYEAGWQEVEQEAEEELVRVKAHRALPVAVGAVAPGEDDVVAVEAEQPVVGVGVAGEVGEDLLQPPTPTSPSVVAQF